MEKKMEDEMETLNIWGYKEDLAKERTRKRKVRDCSGFRVSGFRVQGSVYIPRFLYT